MAQHYRIALLGATGSIGAQTLDIIRRMPERFTLVAAVAQSRWKELAEVAKEFGVRRVVIGDAKYEKRLRRALIKTDVEVLVGSEAIEYVTSTEDPRDRTVMELLPKEYAHQDLKPVGRLDKATEGLLLFTNDGDFANALMHPRHEVKKTYDTWVTGYVPGAEVKLSRPIELDGYLIRPPKVTLIRAEGRKAKFRITIHEGRNRQVRRMCDAVGMHVTRLRRIREGNLHLGDLPKGKWRYLTPSEVEGLK